MNDNIKSIQLADIDTQAGTQVRAELSEATVADYAAQMMDGVQFPPVVVFHDGSRFILADGFHRVLAANRAEFLDILAEVKLGGKPEALRYALQANVRHGLPRSNADKRRSVELALAQWPDLSSREIGRACAVSHVFVESVREALVTVTNAHTDGEALATVANAPRKCADGRTYPAKREKSSAAAGETSGKPAVVGVVEQAGEPVPVVPAPQPSRDRELIDALGMTPEQVLEEMLRGIAIETEEALGITNPEWLSMLADAHQKAADTLREKASAM